MKLDRDKATAYLSSEDEPYPLTLVFSADEARARRVLQDKIAKALGTDATSEMRFHQHQAKEILDDPALLNDLIVTKSFFPGPVGIAIYNATDTLASALIAALNNRRRGDAYLFIQSGNLTKSSKLRNLLEPMKEAAVIGLYADPPKPQELSELIKKSGINLDAEGQRLLHNLGREGDSFSFQNLLEKIALYQGDAEIISHDELIELLPQTQLQAVDMIVHLLLTGQTKAFLAQLKNAPSQGIPIFQILTILNLEVKSLIDVLSACDHNSGLAALRPPLFGARRERFLSETRAWSLSQLLSVQKILAETEQLSRRGSQDIYPIESYIERQFIKISFMARSQNRN